MVHARKSSRHSKYYEINTDESKTKGNSGRKGPFPFLSARVPHGGFRSSGAQENPGERRYTHYLKLDHPRHHNTTHLSCFPT